MEISVGPWFLKPVESQWIFLWAFVDTYNIMIYMIFIQCINEIQAEINSLDNDLAVFPLVIQSLGRVQAPWIDLMGNIT